PSAVLAVRTGAASLTSTQWWGETRKGRFAPSADVRRTGLPDLLHGAQYRPPVPPALDHPGQPADDLVPELDQAPGADPERDDEQRGQQELGHCRAGTPGQRDRRYRGRLYECQRQGVPVLPDEAAQGRGQPPVPQPGHPEVRHDDQYRRPRAYRAPGDLREDQLGQPGQRPELEQPVRPTGRG